ncbi:MAG: hypothetical protein JWO03_2921 [Bacteroidetes bacterium]|nr:hypothetical protein [Bacteroidota bacterium]
MLFPVADPFASTSKPYLHLRQMKLKSVIKILCSLLLLLSTLSSYAVSTDHRHGGGEHVRQGTMIDAGGVISTAFSILEDAVMPQSLSAQVSAHLVRGISDIYPDIYCRAGHRADHHFIYFRCGQHAVLPAATPLFISIRRLLI